jgi:hypothetical protein
MENDTDDKYQVFIANIFWSKRLFKGARKGTPDKELPSSISIDIPDQVLKEARKKSSSFNDVIETFCYNLLSKKFGREVNNCQIWLPLEG